MANFTVFLRSMANVVNFSEIEKLYFHNKSILTYSSNTNFNNKKFRNGKDYYFLLK